MGECPNLASCGFFNKYKNNEELKWAVKSYMNNYCKGDLQEYCVRKKVSKALGGPDKVPDNMKPDGNPVPGTTNDNWNAQAKEIANQSRA